MFCSLAACCCSAALSGQMIGNWTLNNTLAGTPAALNTVGNIALGPAISTGAFNGGTEYFGEGGWPAGGLNTSAYIEFSLTPLPGYELNLSGLNLRIRRSNTGSPAGAGPTNWAVRSSKDGFAADIATGTMTHNYANFNVTLGGFSSLSGTVTFRLYGFAASVSTGGISRFVVDNISVSGAAAALPIRIKDFKAVQQNNKIALRWTGVDITAGSSFTIERSSNGRDFSSLQSILETASIPSKSYSVEVASASGKNYFRIVSKETNGLHVISSIAVIDNKIENSFRINSIHMLPGMIDVQVDQTMSGRLEYRVLNESGMLLRQGKINSVSSGSFQIPISASHGIYILQLSNGGKMLSSQFRY